MMLVRCPWYIAGPLLGLLIIGLRASVNRPLGALGGYIDVVDHAARPRGLGFSAYLLLGLVLGGALFAIAGGTFSPSLVYESGRSILPAGLLSQAGVLLIAGLAIGAGARTAGGCTSGHGLCGTSLGSTASIVATMTFFATGVLLEHVFAWLPGGRP